MLLLGFWPAPFLERSEIAVQSLVATSLAKADAVDAAEAVAGGADIIVPVLWPEPVALDAREERHSGPVPVPGAPVPAVAH